MNLNNLFKGLIVIILTSFFLLLPNIATAFFGISVTSFVTSIIKGFSYVINFILGIFFMITSWLAGVALFFNETILEDNSLVEIGWKISRDIANLGFVLAIIIIAIMTILRVETYGAQKMLVKLIGAAILVNFSLVIAGVFINFSNVLTNFFIKDKLGAEGATGLATVVSQAFGPQRLLLPSEPLPPEPGESTGLASFSAATLIAIADLIFGAVFLLIATFVMLVLAFMLFIRFLTLSFLLVISPLAWLFWVLPAMGKYFQQWWNHFFKWTLFAPAATFFIYLSIASLEKLTKSPIVVRNDDILGLSTVVKEGSSMIIIAGILLGGIIVAEKLGIAGAAGAMKMVKNVGDKTKAWAGKQALKGATAPIRTELGQKLVGKMETLGQNRGFLLRTLSAPIRQMGGGLASASRKAESLVKAEQEKMKNMSLEQKARRYARAPNEGKVAILKDVAAEANSLKKEKKEAQKKVSRSKNKLNDANNKLKKAKTVQERTKAQAEVNRAQEELRDAIENRNKVNEKRIKFKVALDMLPIDARNALVRANYDLSKLKIPKKLGKNAIIEIPLVQKIVQKNPSVKKFLEKPLARKYGERGEYKEKQ